MKTYIPPKGETKRNFKDPSVPERPLSDSLVCSEYRTEIQGHLGLSIGDAAKKLGERWSRTAAGDKQPGGKKAARLKEKHRKEVAACRAKGKPSGGGGVRDMGKELSRLKKARKER